MNYIENFPYEVQVIEDWIPLSDGTRLWMKAWMPITDSSVPAVLEYLPYRHGDWTAPRDHERHPYYAGHGIASVRVDIRGHGSSEGVPGDEYDQQEHDDGLEVIDYLARQDWCNGRVGMFGISWGGFNSLQLASYQPEALKAIVTVCSTDDRYDNDVHYLGGSMLAVDMLAWAGTMLAFESRPPDKRVWGDKWRGQWLHRLERMEPYLDKWLSHQTRDDYWKHGSVCEDYNKLDAAVLAVGGWYDPYRDTVFRLVENLQALGKNVRGIIGPWSHQYPDRDLRPGPHIDFLGETLRWWQHWLYTDEDRPEDARNNPNPMDEPLLRSWITDSVPPASAYDNMPGRWTADNQWPSPNVTSTRFELGSPQVGLNPLLAKAPGTDEVKVHSPQNIGADAGRYFPFGNSGDLPVDQRADDGRAVTFDFPLDKSIDVLGNAVLRLRVSSPTERGQIYVRLCDVAPDGSSTLVTRGNLNLSSREGRDKAIPMPVGEWTEVEVPLTGIGYRLPAGHALRVAISSAYWPWVWPQPEAEGFTIDVSSSELFLPVRSEDHTVRSADDAVHFDPVQRIEPLDVEYPEIGRAGVGRPERLVSTDVVKRETLLEVDPAYGGTRIYPDGLHFDEDTIERYWIKWDDPLSARAESVWEVGISRPDLGWSTNVQASTKLSCDSSRFFVESHVKCFEGEEVVFERTWTSEIPRTAS